jgi:mRNA interferase RelE/StbE
VTIPRWNLVVAGPVRRVIDRIPAKVAAAVLDFLVGPLIEHPQLVGSALRGDLEGLHSARVGAYRVVYQIDPAAHTVRVIHLDHQADICRPR